MDLLDAFLTRKTPLSLCCTARDIEAMVEFVTHGPDGISEDGLKVQGSAQDFIQRTVDDMRQSPCSLGVGCEESGVCFADVHGQPERCGREVQYVSRDDHQLTDEDWARVEMAATAGDGLASVAISGRRRVTVDEDKTLLANRSKARSKAQTEGDVEYFRRSLFRALKVPDPAKVRRCT